MEKVNLSQTHVIHSLIAAIADAIAFVIVRLAVFGLALEEF